MSPHRRCSRQRMRQIAALSLPVHRGAEPPPPKATFWNRRDAKPWIRLFCASYFTDYTKILILLSRCDLWYTVFNLFNFDSRRKLASMNCKHSRKLLWCRIMFKSDRKTTHNFFLFAVNMRCDNTWNYIVFWCENNFFFQSVLLDFLSLIEPWKKNVQDSSYNQRKCTSNIRLFLTIYGM